MSQIDTTNSLGLNDQIVSSVMNQQMLAQFDQMQEIQQQENALTPENVNAVISQVCGSQATNTDT